MAYDMNNSQRTLLVENFIASNSTHFQPMFHLYSPWKHQKTAGIEVGRGIEVEHWLKMG